MALQTPPTPSQVQEFNSIWRTWLDSLRTQVLGIITGSYLFLNFKSTGIDDNAISTTITIDPSENVAFTGNINLADVNHLYLGDSDDLSFRHNGTNSYIENTTGSLFIKNFDPSASISIRTHDSLDAEKTNMIIGGTTPKVKSYFDGVLSSETADGGIYAGPTNDILIKKSGSDSHISAYSGDFWLRNFTNSEYTYLDSRNSSGVSKVCLRTGGATPNCSFYGDGSLSFSTKASSTYRTINFASIPTVATGLSSGDVWSNSGVLTIV